LQIAKAHVEGKTDQSIEDSLTASSSRAKSKNTTLEPAKVFSQNSVHLSHAKDAIPALGYR
jgi:hypothetical protein